MSTSNHTIGGRTIDEVVRDAPEPEFTPYPWYVRYPLIAALALLVWAVGYRVWQGL